VCRREAYRRNALWHPTTLTEQRQLVVLHLGAVFSIHTRLNSFNDLASEQHQRWLMMDG
jgi:hypothetical protein